MAIYKGQTLFGLLVSISISVLLLLVISRFYVFQQKQEQELILRLELQNEIQRVVQLIAKDLRRAGARKLVEGIERDNFFLFKTLDNKFWNLGKDRNELDSSCIVFLYDFDGNGCVGDGSPRECVKDGKNTVGKIGKNLFGYKLSNNTIKTRVLYIQRRENDCDINSCKKFLEESSCSSGGWTELLDSEIYGVSYLKFYTISNNDGIEISLKGYLLNKPSIMYETSAIVSFLNK